MTTAAANHRTAPRPVPGLIAACLAALVAIGAWFAFGRTPSADARPAPTFTLVDSSGQPFSSESLQGKAWIASFFFTSCESVCPMVVGTMARLFEDAPKGMHFASFSVDPENDSPAALAAYAQKFDADTRRWHFLTGTRDQLRDVIVGGFQVAMPESKTDLDRHSVRLVLVDPAGMIRGYFNATDEEDLKRLKGILDVYRGAL